MQWNQPFGNYDFQSYIKTVSPPTPQIVGEGDITAITFPDGSVQLYFIPTSRQNQLYPFSVNRNLIVRPTNTEVWFVRTIINPQGNLNILSQPPRIFGDNVPFLPVCPPPYQEYTQKFHYDNCTSTTDIHYFYPSLRRPEQLRYCTETQTEVTFPNYNNFSQNFVCNRPCHCELSYPPKCYSKPQVKSADSYMSVDNERSGTGQQKLEKHKKYEHSCKCKERKPNTSEKSVMTYSDQATGSSAPSDREQHTRRKPKVAIIRDSSSHSCCCSDCAGNSTVTELNVL